MGGLCSGAANSTVDRPNAALEKENNDLKDQMIKNLSKQVEKDLAAHDATHKGHKHATTTDERKKELAEIFDDKLDTNEDGFLSVKEITKAVKNCKELAYDLKLDNTTDETREAEVKKVFETMDQDKNGKISKFEFISYFTIRECHHKIEAEKATLADKKK